MLTLIKKVLYSPHTISALIVLLASLLYYSYSEASSVVENIKSSVFACMLTLITIVVLMFDSPTFIRPHPLFWRFVMAAGVVYQLILVFILFQDLDTVRYLFSFLDRSLGIELPEKHYALDCSLSYDVIWNQMDEFVLAHSFGVTDLYRLYFKWIAKAIMLRDHFLLWILSIMFEVLEYSLEHQLPNFAECWWDHWILDVLICNWLGLWIGMKYCKFMELRKYSWHGIDEIESISGKVHRVIYQFTPASWSSFNWSLSSDLNHFLACIVILSVFLIGELNAFYLKYLFWIPPAHPLNIIRLIFYFLSGSAAINEAYLYIFSTQESKPKKLGAQCWLCVANVITEAIICFKFGRDKFTEPFPTHVKIFWSLFSLMLLSYALWQFLIKPYLINYKSQVSSLQTKRPSLRNKKNE